MSQSFERSQVAGSREAASPATTKNGLDFLAPLDRTADDTGDVAALFLFFLEESLIALGRNRLLGDFEVGERFLTVTWHHLGGSVIGKLLGLTSSFLFGRSSGCSCRRGKRLVCDHVGAFTNRACDWFAV